MTAITTVPAGISVTVPRPRRLAVWATLAGHRFMLSAHTPREILAPLVTPLLFALVIAAALARMIPGAPTTARS
jgi:hypothetical protein